jgi:hypothetical protein
LTQPFLLITPKTLFTVGSVGLVVGLLIYIALGVQSFLAPPSLAIDQPKVDTKVLENKVTVAGFTDPTASLTINGELVTVSADGKFKQDIAMIPGLNNLEFVSVNRVGKVTKQIRRILADYQTSPSPNPSPSVTLSPSPSLPTATPSP